MQSSVPPRSWSFFDRSIGIQLGTIVALLTVLATGLTVLALDRFGSLQGQQHDMYQHSVEPLMTLQGIQRDVQNVERGYLTAALSQDPVAQARQLKALRSTRQVMDRELTTYLPEAPIDRHAAALSASVRQFEAVLDEQLEPMIGHAGPSVLEPVIEGPLATAMAALSDQLKVTIADQAKLAADLEAAGVADEQRSVLLSWSALAAGVLAAAGLSLMVVRRIVRKVAAVRHALDALANGDLTVAVAVNSRDELGRMAVGLSTAQEQLRNVITVVGASADAVASASQELSATSAQIAAAAEETSAQSGVLSAAAEEVSQGVQTVSAGAEEMGASIAEISSNAASAAQVARDAVAIAEDAHSTVRSLAESSTSIGEVVAVITSIAEQTNLLALNATIEAARAGEAGKGFAVVAHEVKELAQETARATDDIARRVQALQADSTAAAAAIDRIGEIIGSISDYQLTIASAVEEQTATTSEISRSIADAANGTSEVATNVAGVSEAAEASTRALGQAQMAVDELARMASDLRAALAGFTY